MKRLPLYILLVGFAAIMIYRFLEQRKIAATETIEEIQVREGYPVITEPAQVRQFKMIRNYTGTVAGVREADAVPVIGEYIDKVMVTEGSWVEEGQIIVKLSQTNPNARYASAKLAYDNAEKEYSRLKKLVDQGALSQQMLDNMALQRDLAKDALATSEQLLDVLAPISGTIAELHAETGKFASPGMSLAKIISNQSKRIKISITADDRGLIKRNSSCVVSSGGLSARGHIDRIALSADEKGRSFTAWVALDEKVDDPRFSSGLIVDVEVSVIDVKDAVTISPDALKRTKTGWQVYVVSDNLAHLLNIDVGGTTSEHVWVKQGLSAGDLTIVSGSNLLADGSKVRIVNGSN